MELALMLWISFDAIIGLVCLVAAAVQLAHGKRKTALWLGVTGLAFVVLNRVRWWWMQKQIADGLDERARRARQQRSQRLMLR